ncbi:MAG TPA: molybdopterin-dependent oxidoreductase [Actinomycetota bacterium]
MPEPVGEEILTISGEIGTTNDRGRLAFDMATLESLGLVSYDVEDPWDQKEVTYTGVLMSELLAVAGAASDARSVRIVALDDYRVSIPIDEIHRWPVLLATRADGEVIGVESGGPSRIIYPYGTFPEIDGVTHDDLWIWSVERMTIR